MRRYLAFDFGAESGRAIVGTLAGEKLELDVLHRFPTAGISVLGRRQWDVTRMYGEMIAALTAYSRKYGSALDGIAVDTWGVDFGLIASDGTLLGNPTHYRDAAHQHAMEHAFALMPREEIYRRTRIQFMPINTAYQLLALAERHAPVLGVADKMLMIGDLFGYLLSGRAVCEYTNASTSQLLDCEARTWDDELIERLGLRCSLFPEIVQPGTVLGNLLPDIASKAGIDPSTPVIAPATHDTASAIVAVPVESDSADWAYLSSGTWSLLGAEVQQPIGGEGALALNFTNEGGYQGTIRLLKNIIGLWIVQECRRVWQREEHDEISYETLMQEAIAAEPFRASIDVDDSSLLAPANMCEAIQALLASTGFQQKLSRGEMVRTVLESLARRYRRTLQEVDSLTGRTTRVLHIIGGGSQNKLLCQMTADACGIPVLAGPVEATAIGNVLVQAIATGAIASWADGRKLVAQSFPVTRYEPKPDDRWVKPQ